jgi:ferritin-like metal-binding protein YciE
MESLLNLRDLLVHEINDLYSAEEQIIEALPKMVENTKSRELKAALTKNLKNKKQQKKRLDQVRKLLKSEEASEEKKGFLANLFGGGGTKCKGTEGLITEGEKIMSEVDDPEVKDAAIIASSQKIEHYEISGYGTARAYARQLGLREVTRLLEQTLKEEKEADVQLTKLALGKVNAKAETANARSAAPNVKAASNKGRNEGGKKSAPKKAPAKKAASSSAPRHRSNGVPSRNN